MYDHPRTLSSNEYNHQDGKRSQEHENSYRHWYDHNQEAIGRGYNSPLWKNSPSPSHPLLSYASFAPNSRTEAIVRGQWELMEMVKNMPESSYELSLKDIVEHQRVDQTQSPVREVESSVDKSESLHRRVKREDENKRIDRNMSFENKGLFLNMVFPVSLKSRKKNKFGGNNSVKVCPKPEGLKGGGERDWWKRKFTGSSDSDTSKTSGSSGSSSGGTDSHGRKGSGFLSACWPFFHSSRGNKSAE